MTPTITSYMILFLAAVATARPLERREVPQEHSHEQFLTTVRASLAVNNPAKIQDPVFALLGNTAAAKGAGSITDINCLQQAVADQAFTNSKAAKDVKGMTAALVYRTLERNSGTVGATSALCTSIKAVNPEIAALQQHQDPASTGAAALNKKIALELAVQIAKIGGDPNTAIQSGTFAPGKIGDPTAKGNTCDDQNDPTGCIFTKKLLVPDVTAQEIQAALASAGVKGSATGASSTVPAAAPAAAPATTSPSTDACSSSTAATSNTGASTNTASTTSTGTSTTTASKSTLNLGSCSNSSPFIVFGPGFDGRNTNSFEPADKATFNHGSALNIGVVANFICDRLNSPCKASQSTIDTCKNAAKAASSLSGQAAADSFNRAMA